MALAPRFIQDNPKPVFPAVATAKAVAVGDICGYTGGTLVKASDTTWNTSLSQTQQDFAAFFLGVSIQAKDAAKARAYGNTEDNRIGVATDGEWEMDLDVATTLVVGDYVGPAKDTGNALVNQVVNKAAAGAAGGIGVVTRDGASLTRARFRLMCKVLPNRS
jgi:hypothetical protein